MSKFKKGDLVRITSKNTTYNLKAKTGSQYSIDEVLENTVKVNCFLHLDKRDITKIETLKPNYEDSNRYKLHKAASATGFSFSKLSRAMGRSDTYISNESKESRFNSRGDLADKRYNQLIIDLAYAERTLNGNPAKVVGVETESLCIEKPLELEPKEVVPVAPVFIPKQKIKSKTEVNKSVVWFILFALVVVILVLVAGIYKSIF